MLHDILSLDLSMVSVHIFGTYQSWLSWSNFLVWIVQRSILHNLRCRQSCYISAELTFACIEWIKERTPLYSVKKELFSFRKRQLYSYFFVQRNIWSKHKETSSRESSWERKIFRSWERLWRLIRWVGDWWKSYMLS